MNKQNEEATLPCPRFELEWIKVDESWATRECIYSIVIPLGEYDARRGNKSGEEVRSEVKAEIGRTRVTSFRGMAPIHDNGEVDTPFRDGAHAKFDRDALGVDFPIVAVCGDAFTIIDYDK